MCFCNSQAQLFRRLIEARDVFDLLLEAHDHLRSQGSNHSPSAVSSLYPRLVFSIGVELMN